MEKSTNIEIANKINEECISNCNKTETVYICNHFPLYVYNKITNNDIVPVMYIHIGYGGDNSTITIINHEEKNVVACMSYGFTLKQLESCICEIITKYIPNTVIDIERNGPGCSLIAKLFNTKLKNNIHYETKEKELNINPLKLFKKTIKIYGADNSVKTCMVLIEVLGKLNNKGEEHGKQ